MKRKQELVNIVIIEDDELIRNTYKILMEEEAGFFVSGVYASVEKALPGLPDNAPDIILLDVKLPGIWGVDAIPTLRKLAPQAHVLILTVYESDEVIFSALKNGASGYLTKNTPSEKIIESIKEVFSGGGVMSAGIAKMVMQSFARNPESPLTKRETEVLEGVSEGKSRSKIATQLFIDLETVKTHIKNIYLKLNVNSKDEAIRVAKKSRYI
ncbi:MAG: response regulator [Chitinophagaceae bacterium]